jgi:bifunctional non-homologous end joining protein LigD
MPLKEYKQKRSFTKTPEPSGDADEANDLRVSDDRPRFVGKVHPPKTDQLRFVVQKHHASHLHYDFRLELDGVLKSWAVPKGPSLDPSVKRLAMMVEDHPISYMTFEGQIPKGNYGAGDVIVWDIGVYHSSETEDPKENTKKLKAGLKKGHINFILFGQKLKGLFSLVKIRNRDSKNDNSWLLIKHEDEYVKKEDVTEDTNSVLSDLSIENKSKENKSDNIDEKTRKVFDRKKSKIKKKASMPHNIKPMLAKLTLKPFDKKDWIYEIKWDGYRAITEIENNNIRLYSRKGNSFLNDYPSIVNALEKARKKDAVFDGEIVALKDGKPDFHSLQNCSESEAPLQYVIFDILYWNGEDLREKTLIERKAILKTNIPKNPQIIYSDYIKGKGKSFFKMIVKEGFEGMLAKDGNSKYRAGIRSNSWLKIKHFNMQEAVIIGYTEPRGSRKKLGALVLGAYDKPAKNGGILHYIGHSGGGFTDAELNDIYVMLSREKNESSPVHEKVPINSPITWVKPNHVCEINFSEWTIDGRMRHPIFSGLRTDKNPEEVFIERIPDVEEASIKLNLNDADDVKSTNVDKVFWKKEGFTKGDVIEYYEKISETILPYLKDRPESMNRHPNGVSGKNFYQKDVSGMNLPGFIETIDIYSESNNKEIKYLICQNKKTLHYLANLGCIEINPWNSTKQNLDNPNYMIIDLDPGGRPFDDLITVALETHKLLEQACEEHYIKTSGKKGLHIMVPLAAKYDYDTIRMFSQLLVSILHKRLPDMTSIERSPAKRKNKIYLDYLQNRRGQTIAAPYSIRPWPGATVSTPLFWKEVKKGLDPSRFNIKTIFKRLEKYGDIFLPILKNKTNLNESIKCLKKYVPME